MDYDNITVVLYTPPGLDWETVIPNLFPETRFPLIKVYPTNAFDPLVAISILAPPLFKI